MYKVFILLFSFFLLIQTQYESCVIGTDKGGIDMRLQAYSQDYKVVGRGFWDLIVNICKDTSFKCKGNSSPAFWVKYDDDTVCYRISNGADIKTELLDCKNRIFFIFSK